MRATVGIVLAAAFFATQAMAAGPTAYRDKEARFVVSVPEGWSAQPSKAENVALTIASPAGKTQGGVCYVAVRDMPQTRDAPQADLDEAFAELITNDFWMNLFATSGVTDVKITTTGDRMQKKRKVFFVVATVGTTDESGKPKEATGRQEVHPVPGSLQFVQCVAAKADYAAAEPQFNAIFTSYEPLVGHLVAQAPHVSPSILMLHADASSAASTKVIAQNIANVPALGSGVDMGVSIAGGGAWEVCEQQNFAGGCHVVSGSDTTQVMRIGSVRRYLGGDTRAALKAALAAEFKDSSGRLASAK